MQRTIDFLQDFLDFVLTPITVYIHFQCISLHAQVTQRKNPDPSKVSIKITDREKGGEKLLSLRRERSRK